MGDSKSFEDSRKLEREGNEQLIGQFLSDDPNPILRVEKDGTIVYANRAAFPLLEHWGVREKERLPQALRPSVLRVLAQKSLEYLELTAGKRIYSAKLSPLPEEGCVNIYGFDISRQVEAEEKLRLLQAKLEKLVEKGALECINANEKLTEEIAERKKIGKILRNNLQFLETLLNTIPVPVFYKDSEGRYMGCNEIFASQILGLTQEQIIGKTLPSLPLSIPEELTEYCHRVALELIRLGGNRDQDVKLLCADGKTRDFLVSRAAFKDEEGKIAGMVGVMQDITQRKSAEEALRNTVSFLEALLDNIPSPVFQRDRNGTYINCNEKFASQIMGLPKEKIAGGSFSEFKKKLTEKLAKSYHMHDQELLRKGGSQYYETEVMCADGVKRDFLFSKATYTDVSGSISGIIGVMLDITRRKEVECALQEREERYRIAAEETGQLVYEYDIKTGRIDWTGAIRQLTGYGFEEFQQVNMETWQAHIHPEDLKGVISNHEECLKTGKKFHKEYRFRRKDGNYFYVEDSGTYLRDENGCIVRLIGVMKDITERNAARAEIEKSEEKFRIIAEQTGQLVYDYDNSTGEIEWAGAIKELTGYSPEEFRQVDLEDWGDHIHPEDREWAWEAHERCMRTGEKYLEEYRFRRKDGSYFHVEDSSVYLRDESGRVYRIIGVLKDISERKIAREILEKSEERFRAVAERTGQLVYDYDLRTNRSTWEGAIEELTGYSYEEFQKFIPEVWAEHLHPEDRQRAVETYKKCLATGEDFYKEYRLRRKDGSYFYAEDNGFYSKDKDGKVYRTAGVIKDITERKLAQEKLVESEERYSIAAEQTGQIVYDYEIKTGKTDWAGAIEEITGYGKEEFQKFRRDEWISHIHPEERQQVVESIEKSLETGDKIHEIFRFRRKDGSYFYVEDSGKVLKDEHGHPYRVVGVKKDITERKLALEKLEDNEKLFRLVAEQTGQGIFDYDFLSDQHKWDGAIEAIIGYSKDDPRISSRERWRSHIHPEDRKRSAEFFIQAVEKGERYQQEYRLRRKDGNYAYVENSGIFLKDEKGRVCRLVGTIKDITERKRGTEELRKNEERFRIVAEQTGQMVYDYDVLEDKIGWAGAIKELTDYSEKEFKNIIKLEDWKELLHPEDCKHAVDSYNRCLETGEKYREEYRLKRKDGNYIYVENRGVFLKDENGRIYRMLGANKDITQLKLSMEKVQESEKKYRSFVENFGGIAFQADRNLDPIFLHGAVEEISGYREKDFLAGKPRWPQIVEPEHRSIFFESREKARSIPNGQIEFMYRIRRKDGKLRWVNETLQHICDYAGKPPFFQGAIHDITERKDAEEALTRTEEIRKKEIHHRIKNNLQVISSLLELQSDQFSEEKVVEAFRESQNRVVSMSIIHEELYRAGDTETLDFSAYLQKLTSELLRSYTVRKEDVKLKLEVGEVFLGMDTAIPLGIIINELISNALKHAFPTGRRGEIQIKLCRKEINENKNTGKITGNDYRGSSINNSYLYSLVVSDNGLGFPENIDFKNTDSLGLQLVNTLVEQLEGTIELEKNRGTTFRISFTETG